MRGTVVVRNRGAGAVSIFAALAFVGIAAFLMTLGWKAFSDLGMLLEYPGILLLGALAAHLGWWKPKEVPAEISADADGVRVDGKLVRARASLARAVILPRAGRSTIVEIRRKADVYPLRITLPSIEDARTFVRSLGLDAREGTTVVGNVVIGADGIAIGRFRRRFIPYDQIIDLERLPPPFGETVSRGFAIRTRSGDTVTVSTIDTRLRDGAYDGDHFFDAAVAARAAARAHGTSAVRVALLRGGRDVKTWLADLRAEEQATYRAASLSEDDLFALLEDPKASDELRAAAAARLAKLDAPRLRIASEGVAAPKVRVAVDAALANDEEALAKALEEI